MNRMSFASLLLVVAAVAAVACGADTTHPDGDATRGEALFTTNCTSCHGADAKSGSAGEDLPGAVADDGVDETFSVVESGKDNGEMPAFKDQLTEQEIADIIAWLQTL